MTPSWQLLRNRARLPGAPGMHVWCLAVGETQGSLPTIFAAKATLAALGRFWIDAGDGLSEHKPAADILNVRSLEIGRDCRRDMLLDLIDQAVEADDIRPDDTLFFYWLGHAEKIDRDNHILYLPALARQQVDRSRDTAWLQQLTAYIGRVHRAHVQYFFFDCCSTRFSQDRVPPPWPDEPAADYTYKKWQRIFIGSGDGRSAKGTTEEDRHRPTLFASAITRALTRHAASPQGRIGDPQRFLEPLASLIAEEWLERNYDGFPLLCGVNPIWSAFVDEIQPMMAEFRSHHHHLPFGRSAKPALHGLIGIYSHRYTDLLLKCNGNGIMRTDPPRNHVRWHGEASHRVPFRFLVYERQSRKLAFCPVRLPGNEDPLAVHLWHFEEIE